MDNPSLNDTRVGASARAAEREFHKGTVRGKKLNLKESVDGEKRLEWVDFVLVVEGVRYLLVVCWYVGQVVYHFEEGSRTLNKANVFITRCNLKIEISTKPSVHIFFFQFISQADISRDLKDGLMSV